MRMNEEHEGISHSDTGLETKFDSTWDWWSGFQRAIMILM